MDDCLIALVALGLSPLAYIVHGWVLTVLWGWFIVPLDVPALNIPTVIGISLIVGLLTAKYKVDNKSKSETERKEDTIAGLIAIFFDPLLVLSIGWIVRLFL